MKKNLLLTIFVAALFAACSKPSLEKRARERIRPATELLVNDPNSLIIQDIQPVIVNDSLCVFSFLAKAKNMFGGYVTTHMEYFMRRNRDDEGKMKNEYDECVYDVSDTDKRIMNKARDLKSRLELHGLNVYKTVEDAAYSVSAVYSFSEDSYREIK